MSNMLPTYTYVLVREDLSIAQQAVQACHACLDSGKYLPHSGDHPHLCLLTVRNEEQLLEWERWLSTQTQFGVRSFREPDLGDSLTAIAVVGVRGRDRNVFRNLPLFQKEKAHVER